MSKNKEQKRTPRNTTREVRDNPLGFIAEAAVTGTGEAILHQEAEGQQSFVSSETLPVEMDKFSDYDAKAILKAAGVKFGEVVEGDPLFQHVELPAGWKKVPTEHSMWSGLLDEKGRKRAAIFYKAAFYDRSAYLNLERRFGFRRDYDRQDKERVAATLVTDCGKVIHTTEPIQLPEEKDRYYEIGNQVDKAAIAWLDANYPDWKNPGAYWE